jgi:hypothetical protein
MHLQLTSPQSKLNFERLDAEKISVMSLSLPYSSSLRVLKWSVTSTKKKKKKKEKR